MKRRRFPVIDSHIHLFYGPHRERQFKEEARRRRYSPEEMQRRHLSRSLRRRGQPAVDESQRSLDELGRLWLMEFDENEVEAGAFIPAFNDFEELEAFRAHDPSRLLLYARINPTEPSAPSLVSEAKERFGIVGVKLNPVTDGYHVFDERAYPTYEMLARRGLPALIHFGISIGYSSDLRYGNPLDLHPVLRDFPELNAIIAHFGCGFLREALFLCYQCENVLLDTSSSNLWMEYLPHPITLKEVFRKALHNVGAGRVVFGTDSSYFPRGFRRDILELQLRVLEELNLSEGDVRAIMGGNISRLWGLKEVGAVRQERARSG